jgi:hypothetical protein
VLVAQGVGTLADKMRIADLQDFHPEQTQHSDGANAMGGEGTGASQANETFVGLSKLKSEIL